MAGINLTQPQYDELVESFVSDNVDKKVCWRDFVEEVDSIFGKPNLEKVPLESVDREPANLIDSMRFSTAPAKTISAEAEVSALLEKLAKDCKDLRINVKPFFDDACTNQNSERRVGHVTKKQFHQVLKNHVARSLSETDVNLIIDKFEDNGMVNYVAFASVVDPKEEVYHPYLLTQTVKA